MERANLDYFMTSILPEWRKGKINKDTYYAIDNKEVVFVADEPYDYIATAFYLLDVYKLKHNGGCIDTQIGDIEIAHIEKTFTKFNESMLTSIAAKLAQSGINIRYDGNDLIIDDQFKIASSAIERVLLEDGTKYYISFIHISLNVNLNHIKAICIKKAKKKPAGLSNWGYTTEQIENWIVR